MLKSFVAECLFHTMSRTNVASVGSVFNDTRKVKVLSLPETIKEKSTFRAKALRRELVVISRIPNTLSEGPSSGVSSDIKDTKHALQIFQNNRFNNTHKFIFTMDVKSLYTAIPHRGGLRALKFFLGKHPNQEPSTSVLVRLAELVLTLNNFSFDGEHYQQLMHISIVFKR